MLDPIVTIKKIDEQYFYSSGYLNIYPKNTIQCKEYYIIEDISLSIRNKYCNGTYKFLISEDRILCGDDKDNFLVGNADNNTIEGNGGNDWLFGEEGNDLISGGQGTDHIKGSSGNDILYGNDGNDWLRGGDGDDIIYNNAGLFNHSDGGNGNDTIYGGNGTDWITGGNDNDRLEGSDGDDFIEGNDGNDQLNGGRGNDTYIFAKSKNWGNNVIKDEAGYDMIMLSRENDDTFSFDNFIAKKEGDNLIVYKDYRDANNTIEILNFFNRGNFDRFSFYTNTNLHFDRTVDGRLKLDSMSGGQNKPLELIPQGRDTYKFASLGQ